MKKSKDKGTTRCVDYLAVLGLASPIEAVYESSPAVSPYEAWIAAITDLCVVFPAKAEQLPEDGYELLQHTTSGLEANTNSGGFAGKAFIGFRRRKHSGRMDHITDIALVYKGYESVPEGYELLAKSVGGHPADLNSQGIDTYIAIKRASADVDVGINNDGMVCDLCMILKNKGEHEPFGFRLIEKNINRGSYGDSVYLGFCRHDAVGLCNTVFRCMTRDRYPQTDEKAYPLPAMELPLFCFPHGLHLLYASRYSAPVPTFFTFVFTNAQGVRNYVACMCFYETLGLPQLQEAFNVLFTPPPEFQLPAIHCTPTLALREGHSIYTPKCVCLISHFPFYRAMRRFLRQLYSISLSPSMVPVEKYVATFVSQIPLPIPGGRAFEVLLDFGLLDAESGESSNLAPIMLQLHRPRFFPSVDLDFSEPLRCLSVNNLIGVLALLLQEEQCIFLCSSGAMLTEVMDTLRSLLFPLDWQSAFIPRLPNALAGCLGAPGGFMIGLNLPSALSSREWIAHRDDRLFSLEELQPDAYVIDLNQDSIFQFQIQKHAKCRLAPIKPGSLTRRLPSQARRRLEVRLQNLAEEFRITPQSTNMDIYDSAFEFAPRPDSDQGQADEQLNPLRVRDAFGCFMAELLGDLDKYLQPVNASSMSKGYMTLQEVFHVSAFVQGTEKSARAFTEEMLQTQMFSVYVQQKAEMAETDEALVFFERFASFYLKVLHPPETSTGPSKMSGLLEEIMSSRLLVCDLISHKRSRTLTRIPAFATGGEWAQTDSILSDEEDAGSPVFDLDDNLPLKKKLSIGSMSDGITS